MSKPFQCPECWGTLSFKDEFSDELLCGACSPASMLGGRWTERLQIDVRGAELYAPNDPRNPVKGLHVVLGPTSEMTTSDVSIEHAALVFLATVCKDHLALKALRGDCD